MSAKVRDGVDKNVFNSYQLQYEVSGPLISERSQNHNRDTFYNAEKAKSNLIYILNIL